MDSNLRRIRESLARAGHGHGSRGGYSDELRDEVVRYAERRRNQGASMYRLSGELGLPVSTLSYWLRRAGGSARFRPVVVATPPSAMRRGVATVVSPSGYRVEGLEVAEVVEILRALA